MKRELETKFFEFNQNNSNKCTMVYDEKLVRIMIHRLQERIKELEQRGEIKFPLPTSVRDGY